MGLYANMMPFYEGLVHALVGTGGILELIAMETE